MPLNPNQPHNHVDLSGTLLAMSALRYTPAGVPAQQCVIAHQSLRTQNGMPRRVTLETPAILFGPKAPLFGQLAVGEWIRVSGFLSSASDRKRRQLVLHIEEFERLQGRNDDVSALI